MRKYSRRMRSAITAFSLLGFVLAALTSSAQRRASDLTSPEIMPDNSVIFRLHAPDVQKAQVSGTWPGSFGNIIDMQRKDSIFEVQVGPLPSDMYEYEFILDGVPTLDPLTNMVTRDGAWIQNRLMVPGEKASLFDVQAVPHGDVASVWYYSAAIGEDRRMSIYTPPGYNDNSEKYPVLYLLHGGGGDEEGWLSRGRSNYLMDNLIASDQAEPMLVVMTNGNPLTMAAPLDRTFAKSRPPAGIGSMARGKFEESLVKDVIPYIEENYRVIADADHRAITGFSMGGYQTQNVTNDNPDLFNYIGVMSMGLFNSFRQDPSSGYDKEVHVAKLKALKESNPHVYWIAMGDKDFLYETAGKLMELYDEVGLPYTYRENEGRHDWNSWRLYLSEFAPQLFKK